MDQFGQSSFRHELDGANIHKLSNILTLDVSLHTNFDRLDLWLEADPVGLTIIYQIMLISMPCRRKLTPTTSVVVTM